MDQEPLTEEDDDATGLGQFAALNHEDITELFHLCDADSSGYIEKAELGSIVPQLDNLTLERLMQELDCDGDGRISLTELESGLHKLTNPELLQGSETNNNNGHMDQPNNKFYRSRRRGQLAKTSMLAAIDEDVECSQSWSCGDLSDRASSLQDRYSPNDIDRYPSNPAECEDYYQQQLNRKNSTIDLFRSLDSHNEAFQVYCHLAQDDSQMLQKFEVFLEEAVQKIKEQSKAKDALEVAFDREQKKQQQRMKDLEDEADVMTKKIEQKVVQQLEARYDDDRNAYEEEITVLRENLEKMRQLESELKGQAKDELDPLRSRLNEMEKNLRKYKSEKMEAETNALMAKSQLAAYKHSMEQHSADREKDKELVLDYMTEQMTLAKQVQHLQDMNKQLQETNVDLSGELVVMKRKLSKRVTKRHKPSLHKELANQTDSGSECNAPPISAARHRFNLDDRKYSTVSLSEELERASSVSSGNAEETEAIDELSTLHSHSSFSADDEGEETDGARGDGLARSKTRNIPLKHQPRVYDDTSEELPQHYMMRLQSMQSMEITSPVTSPTTAQAAITTASTPQDKSADTHKQRSIQRSPSPGLSGVELSSSAGSNKVIPYRPYRYKNPSGSHWKVSTDSLLSTGSASSLRDSTPQRLYKVIFAGDSGVGKTSFILHLCKGIFQPTVSSTLGIDFHTKNIEVDNTRVTLQLWDTAGQERFRCISTSYFRKADGVVLLYDCCAERSFLSVRQWVDTIRSAAETEDLPIMICGNKIDLRGEKEELGFKVVSSEMGEQLANQCKTMFCELSAKTGHQLASSIQRLGRVMKEREDEGIKCYENGLKLMHQTTSEKKEGCCS